MEDLKAHIREVPDFPKPGINFYDITTLLQDPLALRMTVDRFVWLFAQKRIDKVVGIESRGFMFAPIVAYDLNAGFVPVRKPGKLPYHKIRESYDLEYGTDSIEMHSDAIRPGEHVLIVDDLVA
ncbi:MAG TPA: adenine phosphoribosyltransferase, partial [Thermoanaerobaculia bacterium]|nr:adenine phosphoribosyltransferase [Thermoanaerobaculia bacterium]